MKQILLTLSAVASFGALSAQAQSNQDIGTLLPENTSMLGVVQNLSTFYELDEDHAVKRMVGHPAINHLYGEMFESMGELMSEETLTEIGLSEEDLARLFPGRLAVAGNLNFSMLMDAGMQEQAQQTQGAMNIGMNMKGLSVLMAADTTITEAELAELVESMGKRIVETNEEVKDSRSFQEQFEGYPMTRLEVKEIDEEGNEAWTSNGFILADGMLVVTAIADNKADMKDHIATDMVRRIKAQGAEADSLAGTRSYIDARDQLDDADFFVFAPLEDIAKAMETALSEFYDNASAGAGAGGEEAGGFSIGQFVQKDALMSFLGLTDFKRFTLAAKIQPDGIEMVQELATTERTGVFAKLLNYEPGIVLPEMDPAGLKGITVSGYDIAESIENIMAEIPKLSPIAGMLVQGQMAELENQGMNIRSKMLPALEPGVTRIYGYVDPKPAEDAVPSHAIILKTSDPIGMKTTMSELMGFMATLPMAAGEVGEPREFMGESIVEADSLAAILAPMVNVDPASSGSYAIVGDKVILCVGEKGWMDHVIANMKKGTSSLEDHETVKESWNKWGNENLVEFTYEDLATQMRMAVYGSEEGISVRAQTTAEPTDEEVQAAAAIDTMPSLEGFNFSVTSKSYDTPEAWVSRIYIAEKP